MPAFLYVLALRRYLFVFWLRKKHSITHWLVRSLNKIKRNGCYLDEPVELQLARSLQAFTCKIPRYRVKCC